MFRKRMRPRVSLMHPTHRLTCTLTVCFVRCKAEIDFATHISQPHVFGDATHCTRLIWVCVDVCVFTVRLHICTGIALARTLSAIIPVRAGLVWMCEMYRCGYVAAIIYRDLRSHSQRSHAKEHRQQQRAHHSFHPSAQPPPKTIRTLTSMVAVSLHDVCVCVCSRGPDSVAASARVCVCTLSQCIKIHSDNIGVKSERARARVLQSK